MKTSKKLISILLAVMMVIGMVSTAFAGTIKDNANGKIDTLISQNSIAEIAEDLITDINNSKQNITGTVLRLVFLFVDDETLAAKIGDKDVTKLTDEELATILVSWLDAKLPELTKDITSQRWYSPLQGLLKLGGISLNLSSTRGALNTVYSALKSKAITIWLGDLKSLNVSSLKDINKKSDLDVVYQTLQFLADNTSIIKKVVNGNISLGSKLDSVADDVNSKVNEALGKDAIKEKLYDAVLKSDDGEAKVYVLGTLDSKGEATTVSVADARLVLRAAVKLENYEEGSLEYFLADVDGEGGISVSDARLVLRMAVKLDPYQQKSKNTGALSFKDSSYKDYTADEILAAAFIKLVRNNDEVVSKADCDEALGLTVYQIISKFGGEAIANYGLLAKLNEVGKNAVEAINNASEVPADIKAKFAYTDITEAETNDLISKMADNGIISQEIGRAHV